METWKLITANFPTLILTLVPIVLAFVAIRFIGRASIKILVVVIGLAIAGVITVSSANGKTELTYNREDGTSETITVSTDENGRPTDVEYGGYSAAEIVGTVKDTVQQDVDAIKGSSAFEEFKESMADGAEKSVSFIEWLRGIIKNTFGTSA